MCIPNLFDYATSELSQDAFLCWLFSWADNKYKDKYADLNNCAKDVIKLFSNNEIDNIESIEVHKQENNIDAFIIVNNQYLLIVEDKTDTGEHGNQLNRYKDFYSNYCKNNSLELICSYYKSGTFPISEQFEVERKSYIVVNREQMINTLNHYENIIENNIFNDYLSYLKSISKSEQKYKNIPIDRWEYTQKKGFFHDLDKELSKRGKYNGSWSYVANPNGGFIGFWWHFRDLTDCCCYLQFNETTLTIRIGDVITNQSEIRKRIFTEIMNIADKNEYKGKVRKPDRFGTGNSMAVSIIDKELWLAEKDDGLIDLEKTVEKLVKIQSIIDELE